MTQTVCDKCMEVTTNPHHLRMIDHGEIKDEWDFCDRCYQSVKESILNNIDEG